MKPVLKISVKNSVKISVKNFWLACCLLLAVGTVAGAAPPTLEPAGEFPASVLPNHQYTFHLTYKQPAGDPPTKLQMIVDAPYGQINQSASVPLGDPTTGVDVSWNFTPEQSGQYQVYFMTESSTGGVARYPAGSGSIEMDSPNSTIKFIVLGVGLLIGLLFLPFVVYSIARAANRRGDPGAAARVALLIGIVASYALFLYLFYSVYSVVPLALAGVVTLGLLVVLFTRRRAV